MSEPTISARDDAGTANGLNAESRSVAVSVIIPLKRINENLRECLAALRKQKFQEFDVYVVTDEPEALQCEGLRVHLLSSGNVPPNIKRMMAAEQSNAEIVALIDDDAYPDPLWLERALEHFKNDDVAAVGGPGVTPPSDSSSQQASGAVYASPLVSGGYTYRYLPQRARPVRDVPSCNLIVRREPFLRHVPACVKYWPGEDTKLCLLIAAEGRGEILYDPLVKVFHHRRKLFWGHFRQVWNYAVHRGFFSKRYPETSRKPAYFVPSLFVLGNIALLALWPTVSFVRSVALICIFAYAAALVWASLDARRSHRANPVLVAAGIYLTHLTYGVGFLVGCARPDLDH